MRRRKLLTALATIALGSRLVHADERSHEITRIGVLTPAENPATPSLEAFRRGLHELGYVDGQNIIVEYRCARGDYATLQRQAEELTKVPVRLIVTDGSASAQAAAEATRIIPIVMAIVSDPVALRLTDNLARPGGNITGFTGMSSELTAKRVDLLSTAVPGIATIVVLLNPSNLIEPIFRTTEQTAHALGLAVTRLEARSIEALTELRPNALGRGSSAVLVLPDAMFWNHHREIVALTLAARVPAIYPEREYADDGGLMAYGPNVPDAFRRAADYVDRILRGAKPAELPIQEPAKFDFVVNLKTAKALGLTIPQTIFARADEVIE
jgi:putative ABC transport system substrate-binding protein